MATNTTFEQFKTSSVTIEEIWKNLEATDKEENKFHFSTCRDRHIIILGSKEEYIHIMSDVIQHDTYDSNYSKQRKNSHNSITYVTVHDDPTCNVCIINLIDMLPIEKFINRVKKNSEGPISSIMDAVDKHIYQYASSIDLILLVCADDDYELMKNMKNWASDRGHIMALVLIVSPLYDSIARQERLLSLRETLKLQDDAVVEFFEKGVFCISDLSYKKFQDDEKKTAQSYVNEWRSKILRICIGGPNHMNYEIKIREDKHSKRSLLCNAS